MHSLTEGSPVGLVLVLQDTTVVTQPVHMNVHPPLNRGSKFVLVLQTLLAEQLKLQPC